jgi:GGDEF domain-containing protein
VCWDRQNTDLDKQDKEIGERLLAVVREGSSNARSELLKKRPELELKETEGKVSASMGFAVFDRENREEFMERADFYGYVAKRLGRNRVVNKDNAEDQDRDSTMRRAFMNSKTGAKK